MTTSVENGARTSAPRRQRGLFGMLLVAAMAFGLFTPATAGAQSGTVQFRVTVAEGGKACPGDLTRAPRDSRVQLCYEVINNTDAPIGAVTFADDNPLLGETGLSVAVFGRGAGGVIRPGESATTKSSTITVADEGTFTGRATATIDGKEMVAASVLTVHKPIVEVDGMLSARASRTVVRPGTAVRFDYLLVNTTGRAVMNPTISDSGCMPATYVAGDLNSDKMLDPGERWSMTCSTVVNAALSSRATSSAVDASDKTAISITDLSVAVAGPALTAEESAASVAALAEETAAQSAARQEAEASLLADRAAAADAIAAAAGGPSATLPRTGPLDRVGGLAGAGLWLLLAGAGFVVLSWRPERV